MAKNKTREEWIELFNKYEIDFIIPKEYFETLHFSKNISKAKRRSNRNTNFKIQQSKVRFRNKYKLWKIMDNAFMINSKQGRYKKETIVIFHQ